MNPLGKIFQKKVPIKQTRSYTSDKLFQPINGHPEAATNKLAQIWNLANLSSANSLGSARSLAREWYKKSLIL